MPRPFVFSVLLILLGCSATPPARPPPEVPCVATRTFQVVNHGWHTGILIAGRDLLQRLPRLGSGFGSGDLIELGWGDAAFYRTPEAGVGQALGAAFRSGGSVLHVVRVPIGRRGSVAGGDSVSLTVGEDGYRRLLDHLAASFARTPQGDLQPLGPGLYGDSRFYRANGRYSLFHNCNTWVAEAVAASGIALRSTSVVTAEGVMSRLREAQPARPSDAADNDRSGPSGRGCVPSSSAPAST
ncbi:hypothetical protein D3C80_149710 [compost metagenome]